MKLCRLIFLSVMLSTWVGAGDLQSRFELQQAIDGRFEAGQQGRLVLDGDVFGQARNVPADLRIFAPDGTQWPFFLHIPQDKPDFHSINVEILNRSWVDGAESYLQFDVVIPKVDGIGPVHNRLELVTTGADFIRRVDIFTSDPAGPAGHMASGYLIDFSSQRDARNRIIRYPDSDSGRLQVRIYPNAQGADETFGITSAFMRYNTSVEVEREPVGFSEQDVGEREQQEGVQTQILDIGQTDRPVEFMTFDVADTSYARRVSIYGRNDEHEVWQRVGGGEIHALPNDRADTIRVRARFRFLKVQVYHYDDQPLNINAIELEAIPRYLVFEAAAGGTASLCFRAWDINAARYDLQGRIKKESIAALPVYQTLDTMPNQAAKAPPWRKYSTLLGGLAVALVSLLVLWIIVGMLRQQAASDTDT